MSDTQKLTEMTPFLYTTEAKCTGNPSCAV